MDFTRKPYHFDRFQNRTVNKQKILDRLNVPSRPHGTSVGAVIVVLVHELTITVIKNVMLLSISEPA